MEFMIAMMAISAVAEGVSLYSKSNEQHAASKARLDTLKLQSKQSTLKHQQEILSNYDILENTISTQIAQSTVKGVAPGSLSLEAIQRDTYNRAAKEEHNLELEESLYQKGLNIEKRNVKRSLHASLFGDIADSAFQFGKIARDINK